MRAGVLTTSVMIQTVFLVAVPIAAVSFVLTWLLPEIRLRHTVGDAHPETAQAAPGGHDIAT